MIYKSRPLFSVIGDIIVWDTTISTQSMLLDCGATTVYVSRRWGGEHQLKTAKFHGKNILIKLGDNQIKEAELKIQSVKVQLSGLDEAGV
ncbi:unnamed protein product [Phytophthora fragariaefolia]|uniref:Unnamed protein product n=1 Tax=Phytophthora fragariaefolia TaxID=1490495 RepID=A0A9W7D4M3_9STRA|nr:unnamed protein product [Phytophthora fragariaefolia]